MRENLNRIKRKFNLAFLAIMFVLLALTALLSAVSEASQGSVQKINVPAIVAKTAKERAFQVQMPTGSGSAVYLMDGVLLTNAHVCASAIALGPLMKLTRVESADGNIVAHVDHIVIAKSPHLDICALVVYKLTNYLRGKPKLKVNSTIDLKHVNIFNAGFPRGGPYQLLAGTLTRLEVVPMPPNHVLFTAVNTAKIQPGCSGGGVYNEKAELVGLTNLYYSETGEGGYVPAALIDQFFGDQVSEVIELVTKGPGEQEQGKESEQ